MVERCDESGSERSHAAAELVEVVGVGRRGEDLVEDGQEVVQGGDGGEGLSGSGPEGAAGGGEQQSGLDGLERDTAGAQSCGEAAVGTANVATGAGRVAVELQEPVDVAQGRGWGGSFTSVPAG